MKTGWYALEELTKELGFEYATGNEYYYAYNRLQSKVLNGEIKEEDITKKAIIEEVKNKKSKSNAQTKPQELHSLPQEAKESTKNSKPQIDPQTYARMSYNGEPFYNSKTGDIYPKVFLPNQRTLIANAIRLDGSIVKVDFRDLTEVPKEKERIDKKSDSELLEELLAQLDSKDTELGRPRNRR